MSPSHFGFYFGFGKRGIINRQVGTARKRNHLVVAFARKTLSVAKQCECAPAILETIAIRAIRVIEQGGVQGHIVVRSQSVARLEVVEFNFRLENFYRHGKPWRTHEHSHDMFDAVSGREISRPDSNAIFLAKKRCEKRQPGNMVEMAVRDKNIDVANFLVLEQLDAERTQSGPGVKNKNAVAAANLDAWRIAAVSHRCRAGTGDASSDSPEPNPHGAFQHSGSPEKLRCKYYLE